MKTKISRDSSYLFKLLLVTLSILIVTFSIITYSFNTGLKMTSRYAPLIEATIKIKLEVTTAHLWFEEIMSGDSGEEISSVYKHIQNAVWHAKAMLYGDSNNIHTFIALKNKKIKNKVKNILKKLHEFEDITNQRYLYFKEAGVGSEYDKKYDALFKSLVDEANVVEVELEKEVSLELESYTNTYYILLIILFLFIVMTSLIVYRKQKQRHEDINSIIQSNENLIEQKKIEEKLKKEILKTNAFLESFKHVTDESNIVSKSDLRGNITYVNDNFCKISGYEREELIGQPHSIIRHRDSDSIVFKDLWQTIQSKKTWSGVLKNRKKDNGEYWVDITISPILDENGEILEYIAIRHDITEMVNNRAQLVKNAQTDTLTGLGNRFKLLNDIQKKDNLSLALIDIDNFSEINDFYGHKFADLVLIEFGNRLIKYYNNKKYKKFYRVQSDIFAVLGTNYNVPIGFNEESHKIIKRVSLDDFVIQSEELSLQVTVSLSFEKDKTKLFSTADMMMHIAKREQKDFLLFDETLTLDKEYENNIKWTKKLKNAIQEDRLVPFYQPIVNNATGEFEKYEALVRMIDTDGEVISPFFFLDIAKRTKNYIELTKTVIEKSFETFKDMDVEFSVNLTLQDIKDEGLKQFIFAKLEESQIGHRVVFEIVESEGIENFDEVTAFIEILKSFGCKIAIDDFGTGYSNFEYLIQLKADYIKIDGSMIQNLDTDENVKIVVSTIVDFAKKMNIKTIAEFVKNETIYKIVKELDIDYSQGFYFGEPCVVPKTKKEEL